MSIDNNAVVLYGAKIDDKIFRKLLPNPNYNKPNPLHGKYKFDPETGRPVEPVLSTEEFVDNDDEWYDGMHELVDKYKLDLITSGYSDDLWVGQILATLNGSNTDSDNVSPIPPGVGNRMEKLFGELGASGKVPKLSMLLICYQT